jgi:hypothetical protein
MAKLLALVPLFAALALMLLAIDAPSPMRPSPVVPTAAWSPTRIAAITATPTGMVTPTRVAMRTVIIARVTRTDGDSGSAN